MEPQVYTQEADDASSRYLVVLQAWRSLLSNSLSSPFSQKAVEELRANAVSIGETYFATERKLVKEALQNAAETAQKSAQTDLSLNPVSDITDVKEAFLEQSEEHLLGQIRAQLLRDIETLIQRFREFAIEAHIGAAARGFSTPSVRLGFEQDRVRFYFRDRAARLYPSQKHIRTIWRQSLVSIGAEFYAMEAAERGCKSCVVEHLNPDSKWFGMTINLGGARDGNSFIELRDEVFHPNSDAMLKAVI